MVRKLVEIALCIVCFILQITLFKALEIASVSPNLLIVLVAAIGFMKGPKEGMLIGFISGFFVDIYFSPVLGFYALVYMLMGLFNGLFKKEFFPDDIKLPMLMIALSDFLYNITIYVVMFLFRGDTNLGYYLINVILPEVVYTMIVAIVLYLIILKINQRLEINEKRSASKFG
ncbi:MAG: rod shape-determining protein MreD [Lachnospiraceae bacterium]|nr:rod shape-determining protein MreD [Lachnospiraceae bacterium]